MKQHKTSTQLQIRVTACLSSDVTCYDLTCRFLPSGGHKHHQTSFQLIYQVYTVYMPYLLSSVGRFNLLRSVGWENEYQL